MYRTFTYSDESLEELAIEGANGYVLCVCISNPQREAPPPVHFVRKGKIN